MHGRIVSLKFWSGALLLLVLFSASIRFGWLRIEFSEAETGTLVAPSRAISPRLENAVRESPRPLPEAELDSLAPVGQVEPAVDRQHAAAESAVRPASHLSAAQLDEPAAPLPPATDLDAHVHAPGRTVDCRGIVVVFLSIDCPISNGCLPELNRLAAKWWTERIELYGVISGGATDSAAAQRHRRQYQIRFPVLFDAIGQWRDRLRPTHTPQAFVLDARGVIVYSGRIDDQYAGLGKKTVRPGRPHLERAVQAVVQGRPVEIARTEPIGCLLEEDRVPASRLSAPSPSTPKTSESGEPKQAPLLRDPVTYSRDVAPILQAHCAGCHRPGAVAPFSLLTYQEARRHARQIALVARSRVMPPWKPVASFGEFRDERRLTEREIELLEHWAEAGAPEGDPADAPAVPEFSGGWQLGRPDLVLRLPEAFEVPAEGADIYRYFVIPAGLTEDRWVKAVEFYPTNPRVVHHASFSYDLTGQGRQLDAADPGPGYERFGGPGFRPGGTLGGWGPGMVPHPLPAGTARLLPAGADLIVQIHYHPTGKPESDQSAIGIHFAKEPIRRPVGELLVANFNLRIPAGARHYEHHASYTLPVGVTLHAVTPHMHLLGREIQATASIPDGRTEPLVRIADWDFNWHDQYVYARPVRLPRGTRIDVRAVYDNTPSNPFNPNSPPQPVQWGERTVDEMAIGFFDVTTDRPEDLPRLVEHNREYQARQILENPWLLKPPAR